MPTSNNEKQEWIQFYAHRVTHLFEEWQKPLGIDSEEYLKYLENELSDCCDDPLRKHLIETIS